MPTHNIYEYRILFQNSASLQDVLAFFIIDVDWHELAALFSANLPAKEKNIGRILYTDDKRNGNGG